MQTKPLYQLIFTTGAALVAAFLMLATPTVRAGLFDVPSEPADWNGPFVSFNSGGAWGNFDWHHDGTTVDLTRQYNLATTFSGGIPNSPNNATTVNLIAFNPTSHSSDDAAYIGGVDLGYQKQWGRFVGGFAFGFSGTKLTDQSDFGDTAVGTIFVNPTSPPSATLPGNVNFVTDFRSLRKIEQEWSGYAGPRLGFAWNRLLFYATGGVAFAQVDVNSFDRAGTIFTPSAGSLATGGTDHLAKPLTNNSIQVGWYVGGGTDYAFSNTLTAGIEFRHSDYGDTEYHLNVPGNFGLRPSATTVSYDNNSVLFKVSILLGNLGEKHAAAVTGMSKK